MLCCFIPSLFPARAIGKLVGDEGEQARFRILILSDALILLAASPAEYQGEHDLVSLAGDELLSLEGQMPLVFLVQGGVNGIAAADELMEAEGKDRKAGLRIELAAINGRTYPGRSWVPKNPNLMRNKRGGTKKKKPVGGF